MLSWIIRLNNSFFEEFKIYSYHVLLLCNRQRQEEGKSDSEVDEDDGFESFSVSVEDDKEDGKECFMGFIVCLDNYLKRFFSMSQ